MIVVTGSTPTCTCKGGGSDGEKVRWWWGGEKMSVGVRR